MRGLVVSPPDLGGAGTLTAVALSPTPAPVIRAAPASVVSPMLSSVVTFDWRAVFGASAVRAVLEAFPSVRLSSFIRSPARNAQVGGKAGSYHLSGLAGDFVVPVADRSRFVAWLRETFGAGVDIVNEGDHIHVEWTDVTVTPLARILLAAGVAIAALVVFSR